MTAWVGLYIVEFTYHKWPTGLHLGKDSRGAKYGFMRVRGGNGVKIRVRKHTKSRGVWGHAPPEIFCILDSLRLLLMHSQVPENDQK